MVLDPNRVKFPPEGFLEITGTEGGSQIADLATYTLDSYSNYMGYIENAIAYTAPASDDMDLIIGIDGRAETMRIRTVVENSATIWLQKTPFTRSAHISVRMATGNVPEGTIGSWNLTVRKPTLLDKIRNEIRMTQDEIRIADELALDDMISMGIAPVHRRLYGDDVLGEFQQIEPMSFNLGVLDADSTTDLGPGISVPNEWIYTLLGVYMGSSETWPFQAAGINDTFLVVQRDGDYEYIKLDMAGMQPGNMYRCYIPFTDRMRIHIESDTGSGTAEIYAGYVIGKRPATVIDHLKWGSNLPFGNIVKKNVVDALIEKYSAKGLQEKIIAGLI